MFKKNSRPYRKFTANLLGFFFLIFNKMNFKFLYFNMLQVQYVEHFLSIEPLKITFEVFLLSVKCF